MGEGDEGVVVGLRARPADIGLGVYGDDRAEERQRLVDEMAAEVVEQSADLQRVTGLAPAALGLRPPALEPGLEALDLAEGALFDELADRTEVVVPAAVLEDGQQQTAVGGQRGELLGLGGGRGQRFVDDHREPGLQGGGGQRDMRFVRARQDDQIEVVGAVEEGLGGVDRTDPGMLGAGLRLALGTAGRDGVEVQPVGGGDQRRVKDRAGQAVADEADTERGVTEDSTHGST